MGNINVILTKRMGKLGKVGEVVAVKQGYARNCLIPKGIALKATKYNVQSVNSRMDEFCKVEDQKLAAAQELHIRLDGTELQIYRAAASNGHLYGSVVAKDIIDILAEKQFNTAQMKIDMHHHIKAIGEFDIPVILHPEVISIVKLRVSAEH